MQSISSLLQKMQELYNQPHEKTAIDIDLMLDYSRQLYATLLDTRAAAPEQPQAAPPIAVTHTEKPVIPEVPQVAANTEPPHIIAEKEPEPVVVPPPAQPVVPPAAIPQKDIKKLIGINDKYQIISELFHNDKDAYEAALHEINNSGSFTEATDWLHTHVSWNYNWNEDNYTVQLFYGLISQHFSEKGK